LKWLEDIFGPFYDEIVKFVEDALKWLAEVFEPLVELVDEIGEIAKDAAKLAQEIIDAGVKKLETKELKSCQLYYNMGQYKAAAIAFTSLINNYPDSPKAEEYKLMIIKSYYKYATMSIEERREERYAKVVQEVQDFQDRYPESKLLKEAERYLTLSSTKNKVSK
jgi:outer membrane protein assembly factor BamD